MELIAINNIALSYKRKPQLHATFPVLQYRELFKKKLFLILIH